MSARIISTVGRAIDVIVAGRVVSHLRFAAGVCVLAAGLLMGGGAVAVADPGSRDSSGSAAHGDDGTSASGQQPKKPKKTKKDGTDTKDEKKGDTDTKEEKKDSGLAAAVSNPVAAVTSAGAPVTSAGAPVTDVVAPVPSLLAPVTNVVAPVSDVIASVQDMLTSVGGAVVALTHLPSDLSSFLLSIAGVQPVVGIDEPVVGGIDGGGLSAAPGASVASRLPLLLPFADIPGVPWPGNAAGVAPLGGMAASTFGAPTQVGRASSLPGMAPPAPNGAVSMGVESFFRHAFGEVLLAASLWALATVVLPGVGGLVILTAAGVSIGYGLRASRASPVRGHWWSSVRGVKRRMSSR